MAKKTEKSIFNNYLGYILLAVMILAIGIFFIAFNNALMALVISIGISLALFGAFYGFINAARTERSIVFAFKMAAAVICLVSGIIIVILNESASEYVAAIFALLLIVDGSFKINTSVTSRKYNVKLWWLMLIPAVPLVAGGFWVTKFPLDNKEIMSVFLGILIIIDSIANVMSVFFVPKLEDNICLKKSEKQSEAEKYEAADEENGENEEGETFEVIKETKNASELKIINEVRDPSEFKEEPEEEKEIELTPEEENARLTNEELLFKIFFGDQDKEKEGSNKKEEPVESSSKKEMQGSSEQSEGNAEKSSDTPSPEKVKAMKRKWKPQNK